MLRILYGPAKVDGLRGALLGSLDTRNELGIASTCCQSTGPHSTNSPTTFMSLLHSTHRYHGHCHLVE